MMRSVYRHAELDRVLNPKSIAIVGASPKVGSFGNRVLGNLAGFDGDIYLVNSKYAQLGERRCFPSIASLPVVPDCVAVTVPRESAEDIVREAAYVGAGGVILYASGYAETQLPARVQQQQRLCDIARESGLIVVGFGGVLVELLRDSAVDLAPINAYEASRMLRNLRGSALFDGFRGGAAVDITRLADIIVRLSEFAADQRNNILEADVNPIICSGDRLIAVDALILRRARSNPNNVV